MKDTILHMIVTKLDQVIAFVSGDLLATYLSFYFLPNLDWVHPLIKLCVALFVGIFGGVGGLVGKDLYTWLKKKLK